MMVALREDSTQEEQALPIDQVIHGDALAVLRTFPDNSVDSVCVDPPAGIHFMGKSFDSNRGGRDLWIAWLTGIMAEALRVLKPGAFCLVWSLPRTSHWTSTALENSGFEVRDVLYNLVAGDTALQAFVNSLDDAQRDAFARIVDGQDAQPASILSITGQGFPKSLDLSKAIDRHLHAKREVIGVYDTRSAYDGRDRPSNKTNGGGIGYGSMVHEKEAYITAPATPEARAYAGFGSSLKPACENWIMCRKPLERGMTLAGNTLKWGVGGLNVDASRVGVHHYTQEQWTQKGASRPTGTTYGVHRASDTVLPAKRYPSHLLLTHSLFCVQQGTKRVKGSHHKAGDVFPRNVSMFGSETNSSSAGVGYTDPDGTELVEDWLCDASCPIRILGEQSGERKSGGGDKGNKKPIGIFGRAPGTFSHEYEVSAGTAARFFKQFRPDTDLVPFTYAPKASRRDRSSEGTVENTHPCTKSLQLMKYLTTMITPPGGIVLDCFCGSGSTLCAAIQSGFHFIGIDESEEYVTIARARIAHAEGQVR